MKRPILLSIAAAATLSGCAAYGSANPNARGYGYYDSNHYAQNGQYDYNSPDPRYNGYYPENYYRNDRRYRQRQVQTNERIYRGRDNRYYCRRSDGTTGLIVGGIAGGALGNIIAPGDSKTLGTVLGAIGGAVAGRAIDRSRKTRSNSVTCR